MDKIQFRFTGGMADNNEMNFYEFGRFQYGAARFIYTLENFRQKGRVLQKLRTRVNTDIRVKAATQGSFIQEAIIASAPAIPSAVDYVINCSFEALYAYIWDKILPTSKGEELAVEMSKQETLRAEQRTLQDREHTEQMRIMAQISRDGFATTQQSLAVLQNKITNPQPTTTIINNIHIDLPTLKKYEQELISDLARKQLINDNRQALNQITPEMERKLTSQLRKSFTDMVKPLKSSAHNMEISGGSSSHSPVKLASIDEETALKITSEREDDNLTTVRGSIKSYDVETYYGKLRFSTLEKPISFNIRSIDRETTHLKVRQAMLNDDEFVWLKIYLIRDVYGTPIRASLMDVLSDEEYEEDPLS